MTQDSSEGTRHEFDTVDSKVAYSGAILALRLDQVKMPGGRVAEREVVEHHGAVAVLALDDQGRIALIEQYRHPVGHRLWELPAGLLDAIGEEPVLAAQRELAEETGLSATTWSVLIDALPSPGFTDEAIRVFLAEGLSETERPEAHDEEADITLEFVPLDDVVVRCLAGEIVNATAVAGILALATARATGLELRPADAPWPDLPTAFERRKNAR